LLPVSLHDWSTWRADHPETLALDIGVGRPGGFDLQDMAIVVDFGTETVAYPVPQLQQAGVVNDVVADVLIAGVTSPVDPDSWIVFPRTLDDQIVTLAIANGQLIDVETGSVWDPVIGRATAGPLEGERLDVLPGFTSFPRDFFTFWSDGRLWTPEG
jgi:hypothetical protein